MKIFATTIPLLVVAVVGCQSTTSTITVAPQPAGAGPVVIIAHIGNEKPVDVAPSLDASGSSWMFGGGAAGAAAGAVLSPAVPALGAAIGAVSGAGVADAIFRACNSKQAPRASAATTAREEGGATDRCR